MKVTKFLAMLLCGLTMCLGFASCDDDEDGAGDGPGSGSFNVEGFTSGKLSYAYYEEGTIVLTNFDWAKTNFDWAKRDKAKAGYAAVEIEFMDGEYDNIPTGTFNCYVSGEKMVDVKAQKVECFDAEENVKVTITKSGSTYSISVNGITSHCEIEKGDKDEFIAGSKKFTVSYKGKVEKVKQIHD